MRGCWHGTERDLLEPGASVHVGVFGSIIVEDIVA